VKAGPSDVASWAAWLGDISYSLYLFHPLAFIVLAGVVAHSGLVDPVAGALRFVLQPALAIALAAAMYRYVEAPLSGRLRSALIGRRPSTPAVVA
jgi:exopolysaccharide production protein ExoZ